MIQRSEIHQILYQHALARDTIDIRLNHTITSYFETPAHADIETSSSTRFTAASALLTPQTTTHLVASVDSHNSWISQDAHFLATAIKNGIEMSWVCTRRDAGNIEEDNNWQFLGNVDDFLRVLNGWDFIVLEIVNATPPDRLFD